MHSQKNAATGANRRGTEIVLSGRNGSTLRRQPLSIARASEYVSKPELQGQTGQPADQSCAAVLKKRLDVERASKQGCAA